MAAKLGRVSGQICYEFNNLPAGLLLQLFDVPVAFALQLLGRPVGFVLQARHVSLVKMQSPNHQGRIVMHRFCACFPALNPTRC